MPQTARNPDAPFGEGHGTGLTGAFAPVSDEVVLDAFHVEGEIPEIGRAHV